MSGLVDKWTKEFAKLRNKGQNIFSSGSSPTSAESSQAVLAEEKKSSLGRSSTFFTPLPLVLYSEASISMLVECFSP